MSTHLPWFSDFSTFCLYSILTKSVTSSFRVNALGHLEVLTIIAASLPSKLNLTTPEEQQMDVFLLPISSDWWLLKKLRGVCRWSPCSNRYWFNLYAAGG